MSIQPVWEFVANLGDVNIADYGGFIVYRDTTGVYPPEVELYEANDDETGGTMYRFVLDPPRHKAFKTGGYDRTNPDHMHWYRKWFARPDKLQSAASTCGQTAFGLLRDLASKDPVKRAFGYQTLIANLGPLAFDQDPITFTEAEAQERYREVSRLSHEQVYGRVEVSE